MCRSYGVRNVVLPLPRFTALTGWISLCRAYGAGEIPKYATCPQTEAIFLYRASYPTPERAEPQT